MITFNVGNTEKASRIAAEAQAALNEGDTARAQSLFREAAEDLEGRIPSVRKQSDKHMLRFLAASQYYHGGLYTDAQRLCRRIQTSLLPTDVRPIFHAFVRDVEKRADPRYRECVRAVLVRHFQRNEHQGILDLLQEHPYVLPAGGVAFMRAASCEQINDYRAAALFFADMLRFAPEMSEWLFASAAIPIRLTQEGKLDEAWEYVAHQLRTIPHALTSINASLVRYHQASRTPSNEERRALSAEQIHYFEDAWQRFQLLPPTIQIPSEIRDYMILCFEAAVFAYLRLNQSTAAREICDRLFVFSPKLPGPRTIRGIAAYPAPQAVEDFEEAVRLGETSYIPFYFLAHAAFQRNEFRQAAEWCERTLRANLSPGIRAQMLMSLAIAKARLRDEPARIMSYAEQAMELDPSSPWIQHNWKVFQEAIIEPGNGSASNWQQVPVEEAGEEYLSEHIPDFRHGREEVMRALELVGT